MARNLLNAGFRVRAWNRTRAKAETLSSLGAEVFGTPAEAIGNADFVISMLSDGSATTEVLAGSDLVDALKRGAVWIEMGSVKPEEARVQAEFLAGQGVQHLDAPVSGGTRGAEAGTLAIMVGGSPEVFGKAAPVLGAMGRPVHVGPSGCGQLAKLANQAIVAVTIGAVAEATLLIEKGGAVPSAVRDALKGGFADSTILQQHGQRMSERDFVPGGLSRLQLKDLDNLLGEASALGLELPVSEQVRERFAYLCDEMDGGNLDHSALYLELRKRNQLQEG